jgi:hypothetical protein
MKRSIAALFTLIILFSNGPAATAADAYVSKWGTFKAQTFAGTGDDVIEFTSAVKAGIVTATHEGDANFVIWGLDTSLTQNGLQVNTIGSYSGATEFGFGYSKKSTKAFEITADGDWTVTVKPIVSAAKLPPSGTGDGVFKYSGRTPIWKVTHDGDSNFVIWEYCTDGQTKLVVNKIGAYRGTLKGLGGTCIVAIHADGGWAINK